MHDFLMHTSKTLYDVEPPHSWYDTRKQTAEIECEKNIEHTYTHMWLIKGLKRKVSFFNAATSRWHSNRTRTIDRQLTRVIIKVKFIEHKKRTYLYSSK